ERVGVARDLPLERGQLEVGVLVGAQRTPELVLPGADHAVVDPAVGHPREIADALERGRLRCHLQAPLSGSATGGPEELAQQGYERVDDQPPREEELYERRPQARALLGQERPGNQRLHADRHPDLAAVQERLERLPRWRVLADDQVAGALASP